MNFGIVQFDCLMTVFVHKNLSDDPEKMLVELTFSTFCISSSCSRTLGRTSVAMLNVLNSLLYLITLNELFWLTSSFSSMFLKTAKNKIVLKWRHFRLLQHYNVEQMYDRKSLRCFPLLCSMQSNQGSYIYLFIYLFIYFCQRKTKIYHVEGQKQFQGQDETVSVKTIPRNTGPFRSLWHQVVTQQLLNWLLINSAVNKKHNCWLQL